jgi:hypothetical protein
MSRTRDAVVAGSHKPSTFLPDLDKAGCGHISLDAKYDNVDGYGLPDTDDLCDPSPSLPYFLLTVDQ